MCCRHLAENTGCKKSPKIRHLGIIAQLCQPVSLQLRHVSTIGKNSLNISISSTCPHNMVNFGLLMAETSWRVCGTPANFNGVRVLALLLQRRLSTVVRQTLHDVWPSAGLVYYVFSFGGSCSVSEFCQVQNSLCVQVLHSRILAVSLHGTPAVGVSQPLRRWEEGTTYIWKSAITLGIGLHSGWSRFLRAICCFCCNSVKGLEATLINGIIFLIHWWQLWDFQQVHSISQSPFLYRIFVLVLWFCLWINSRHYSKVILFYSWMTVWFE